MEWRLGEFGSPYHQGAAGTLNRVSEGLTVGGGLLLASLGRRRAAAVAGGALLLAGAVTERWAVFKAASSRPPTRRRRWARSGAGFARAALAARSAWRWRPDVRLRLCGPLGPLVRPPDQNVDAAPRLRYVASATSP